MAARSRYKPPPKFRYRKEIIIDGNQRIAIEVTHARLYMAKCYLTIFSKNVLTERPIVIGPTELTRDEWRELAESCTEVVELLGKRTYASKYIKQTEVY